jgi:predicted transcriptional regulator
MIDKREEQLLKAAQRLNRAQEELQRAQEEWQRIYNSLATGVTSSRSPREGVPQKVLEYLSGLSGKAASHGQIAEAISGKPATVRAALNRLKKSGAVRKAGRGLWRLKQQKD